MIKFVTPEEAAQADLMVCSRISHFADNETGVCADCGHPIYFRPYMPKNIPKVCAGCAVARVEKNNAEQ